VYIEGVYGVYSHIIYNIVQIKVNIFTFIGNCANLGPRREEERRETVRYASSRRAMRTSSPADELIPDWQARGAIVVLVA
jgi:hypothetical protein